MIPDVLIAYWPLWLPLAAVVALVCLDRLERRWERRVARARRSLSEREVALAVRPSPAPIDVEPMR